MPWFFKGLSDIGFRPLPGRGPPCMGFFFGRFFILLLTDGERSCTLIFYRKTKMAFKANTTIIVRSVSPVDRLRPKQRICRGDFLLSVPQAVQPTRLFPSVQSGATVPSGASYHAPSPKAHKKRGCDDDSVTTPIRIPIPDLKGSNAYTTYYPACATEQDVSILAEELAGQICSGDFRIIRRAVWTIQARYQAGRLEPELIQAITDLLLLRHPRNQALNKIRSVVVRATGLKPYDFLDDAYMPSPEEIKAECAAIRREWTNKERKARWAAPTRWTVPRCHSRKGGRR